MTTEQTIEQCDGYKKLLASVIADEKHDEGHGRKHFHNYREKLNWTIERAKHYAVRLNISPCEMLNTWESNRDYWYMNYYQDARQPLLDESVRVFETTDDLLKSIGKNGFRCPVCGGVSSDPYVCKTKKVVDGKECDWKSSGLFGCLGKGVSVFVKEKLSGETFFMPVAWETEATNEKL
jgi:hypothetical protein